MNRAVYLVLAAVAPLASLWLATPPDRSAVGLAVSPFGWPSLMLIHTLTVVPAGLVLARESAKRVPSLNNPGGMAFAGLIAAALGYALVGELGAMLDAEAAGFAARTLLRTAYCLLLAFPWCVAFVAGSVARTDPLLAGVAAVVALGVPALHADRIADQALTDATELVAKDRVARVIPLLKVVADVAPDRPPPSGVDTTARQLLGLATKDLARLNREAEIPPARPTLEFGVKLLNLDRLSEAEAYLAPLAKANPVARLRLGECLQLQGRWADSEAVLRSAVTEMLPKADRPHVERWCVECYDLLVEAATNRRSSADREVILREALEALPSQAGYWHLQLGRHFQLTGRPFEAMAEFDLAEQEDAKLKPQLDVLRRHLREQTPGCVVR